MGYSHRLATLDDLPAIVHIYNAAVATRESTCDLAPVTVESRVDWFRSSLPDKRPIWVAYRDGDPDTVAGYLAFCDFLNGRAGYEVTADLAIYLHPDHHGQGLGRYLLRHAIEHAPTLGVRTIATTIFASNAASIALFEGQGFQRWGYLPGVADLDGITRDVVVVGRRVG
jgi:L-amino acid N-acyltransferase YncA